MLFYSRLAHDDFCSFDPWIGRDGNGGADDLEKTYTDFSHAAADAVMSF